MGRERIACASSWDAPSSLSLAEGLATHETTEIAEMPAKAAPARNR
jgi:hypothetical protein